MPMIEDTSVIAALQRASGDAGWPATATDGGEQRLLHILERMQRCVERLATLDPLTQLPNRQAFDDRAQRLLANAYAGGRPCALLTIGLDDFRLLNKSYGHRIA